MDFIITEIEYADFASLLNEKTGVSLMGDFDCDKPHIEKIANECLSAKNGNYPALYYFSEVGGTNYVLFTYNGRQYVFEAQGSLDDKVDCQPTVCKQFVLQDSCFWREDYMNVPLNEYYCGDNKKPIVFETVADAKALIDSLTKEPYTLQPHEVSRPTYIVTY